MINNNAEFNSGGKVRLAFLDFLLDLVEKGKLPKEDVRQEVDTLMFAVGWQREQKVSFG